MGRVHPIDIQIEAGVIAGDDELELA